MAFAGTRFCFVKRVLTFSPSRRGPGPQPSPRSGVATGLRSGKLGHIIEGFAQGWIGCQNPIGMDRRATRGSAVSRCPFPLSTTAGTLGGAVAIGAWISVIKAGSAHLDPLEGSAGPARCSLGHYHTKTR